MNPIVQISFRNMNHSTAVESRIDEKLAKLRQLFAEISGCHVMVELQHRHQHQGKLYHVVLELTVPGGEIVVSRASHDDHSHEDVYVAIRDAFEAARRQLEQHAGRRRTKSPRERDSGVEAAAS